MISIVYIVKDEQENIEKSIISCEQIADEIIVVDTGSVDDTIKICEELGAKVYHYEWNNDFSAAKNYAVSLCSGDYVVFLDADEYFETPLDFAKAQEIEELFAEQGIDGLVMPMVDIDKTTNLAHHITYPCRIFRNKVGIHYNNKIHEALFTADNSLLTVKIFNYNIIHTGYSAIYQDKKADRNIQLLESIENPKTIDYFYLCREYLSKNCIDKAEYYCDRFFAMDDFQTIIDETDLCYGIYFLKFTIMQKQPQKYSDKQIQDYLVHTVLKQLEYMPQTYFILGEWYFSRNLNKSKQYFEDCLAKQKSFEKMNILKLNTFKSYESEIYFYLAKIALLQDNRNLAINRAGVACIYNKKNKKYAGLLFSLLQRSRDIKTINKNIDFINNVYTPKTKEDYVFIAKALANTGLCDEFVYFSSELVTKFTVTGEDNSTEVFFAELLSTSNAKAIINKTKSSDGEKCQFIRLICLIYAYSINKGLPQDLYEDLMALPNEHRKVYNLMITAEKAEINEKEKVLLAKTIVKFIFLGFVFFSQEFINILHDIYSYSEISPIINALMYGYEQEDCKMAEYFLEVFSDKVDDEKIYYNDYFYCQHLLKEYDKSVTTAQKLIAEDKAEFIAQGLIRQAQPSKSLVKVQREVLDK